MDKSKQYIKMCESAKEIQESWQPEVGDWFLNDYRGTTGFSEDVEKQTWTDKKDVWERIQCLTYKSSIKDYVTISEPSGTHAYTTQDFFKHRHVFLPSQDYLQNMIGDNELYQLFYKLYIFSEKNLSFKTPEQLTLAYVMKEKFDKTWNGSEWIKIEESD